MFTPADIAEYYNLTQVHYEKWWNLKEGLSLHYGIWDDNTKNFTQALVNTNRVLMNTAGIKDGEKILDAGCGVGGAALFLSKQKDVAVTGITLSERQRAYAAEMAKASGLDNAPRFLLMDYTNTSFADESFDVVWACESVSSAPQKELFIKEAYRILKKGGRLVLSDYFLTSDDTPDPRAWIKKWVQTWSISNLVSIKSFRDSLVAASFNDIKTCDYTASILKSARRMYTAALLASIPSELYKLFNPNVSKFARNHYKGGYYQYKTLKKGMWRYFVVLAEKK